MQRGITAGLKYLAYSLAPLVDRRLWPALQAIQILRKTYGSSTCVVRKL